jgi:hypothetical protein
MSTCPSPALPTPASPWTLLSSLRTVLVLGARGTPLQSLVQRLRHGGFTPAVTHSGAAALQRLLEEPVPTLLVVHGDCEDSAHFLEELRQAGVLGWFSLLVVDATEHTLPPGVRAQAQLPGDYSPPLLLGTLERLLD